MRAARVRSSAVSAGSRAWSVCRMAAVCRAVGITSLLDWERLTWSLGWTGSRPPRPAPASSLARPAITSLTFMLSWVPLPLCHTGATT